MEILKDKKIINKLKKKINLYINKLKMVPVISDDVKKFKNGLDLLSLEPDWLFDIQYSIENVLVKYNKIDILKRNFLMPEIDYIEQKIIVRLNNMKCIHRNYDVEIKIEIPVKKSRKRKDTTHYKLYGDIDIFIKDNKFKREVSWDFKFK